MVGRADRKHRRHCAGQTAQPALVCFVELDKSELLIVLMQSANSESRNQRSHFHLSSGASVAAAERQSRVLAEPIRLCPLASRARK